MERSNSQGAGGSCSDNGPTALYPRDGWELLPARHWELNEPRLP
jgi:hypothetical protein